MAGTINVALIGYAFMGKAHSNAYRQVAPFFTPRLTPRMKVLCGRTPAQGRAPRRAIRLGRDRHRLARGRHPQGHRPRRHQHARRLARRDRDRRGARRQGGVLREAARQHRRRRRSAMLAAVTKAGVVHMICHNYRRVPAVMLAKQLIADGQLGDDPPLPRHLPAGLDHRSELPAGVAARQEQGRLRRARRHRRALDRPRALPRRRDHRGRRRSEDVRQDPAAARQPEEERAASPSTMRRRRWCGSTNGAIGTIEATRMAPGRKNYNRFEINGSLGSLAFDLERMNELEVYLEADQPRVRGFRRILVTETGASLHQGVVAAGTHHRLRAHLHAHRLRPARSDGRQACRARTSMTACAISASSARSRRPSEDTR